MAEKVKFFTFIGAIIYFVFGFALINNGTAKAEEVSVDTYSAEWVDYQLTIREDLSLTFNVFAKGYDNTVANFKMAYDGENIKQETVAQYKYANGETENSWYNSYTFEGILP